jgi:outer membrane lipoprotein-sorting protein
MARRCPWPAISLIFLFALGLSSCVVKRRLIVRKGASGSHPTLQVATTPELVEAIDTQYKEIRNFTATVDMTPALGTTEKGQVTEYKEVRGYILFRQPDDIRIMGLLPVLHTTAFDMVSANNTFKLYIPSKNQFLLGCNNVVELSPNKLENLRPQAFLDALLVRPIGAGNKLILENYTDEDNAFYILHEVSEGANGSLDLLRTVWFDRLNLRLARQIIFDKSGNILTDARYSDWKQFSGVPFPKHIEINRPQDEYGVVLDVVKMDINQGVSDDKFVFNQPPGSTLRTLGGERASLAPTSCQGIAR